MSRGEMRLADQRRIIAGAGQLGGEALLRRFGRQVDAIVADTMGARQQARQDRGACWLAYQVRRDAAAEQHAIARDLVEMRRMHLAAHHAQAIGAVLIGRDEQDIRALVAQDVGFPIRS